MAHIILLLGSVSRMTFIVQKSKPRHREVNDVPSVTQLVSGKVRIGIQNVCLQARALSHCHGPSTPSCIRGVCGKRLCEIRGHCCLPEGALAPRSSVPHGESRELSNMLALVRLSLTDSHPGWMSISLTGSPVTQQEGRICECQVEEKARCGTRRIVFLDDWVSGTRTPLLSL